METSKHTDAKLVSWAFSSFCEDMCLKITKGEVYKWAYDPHNNRHGSN